MFSTEFPSESIPMDSKLLARVRDLSGTDILSEMLSARRCGISDMRSYFLDMLQSESKKIKRRKDGLEKDSNKDYIYIREINVNADALDYAICLLEEISTHINAKLTVHL